MSVLSNRRNHEKSERDQKEINHTKKMDKGDGLMYVDIYEEWLNKNRKRMRKEAIEEFGKKKGKNRLLDSEVLGNIDIRFDNGRLFVDINSELGFFSADVKIDDEMVFEIIEYLKEKGAKIKRLVGLAESD